VINSYPDLIKYPKSEEIKLSSLCTGENYEGISIEYVKNIYVSYLEYKAMKNDKEAKT